MILLWQYRWMLLSFWGTLLQLVTDISGELPRFGQQSCLAGRALLQGPRGETGRPSRVLQVYGTSRARLGAGSGRRGTAQLVISLQRRPKVAGAARVRPGRGEGARRGASSSATPGAAGRGTAAPSSR